MTRFSDEVRRIPLVAWLIAVLIWAGLFCLLLFVAIPGDPQLQHWPTAGQIAFAIWPGLLVAPYALLIGYINQDAGRRGMHRGLWTFVAFLPNYIGVILYFVMRAPLLAPCPKCGAQTRAGFAFCPQCGTQITSACSSFKRTVEPGWNRCAYCGNALPTESPGPPAAISV